MTSEMLRLLLLLSCWVHISVADFAQRFRTAFDYSDSNGYVGGFPNFHQALYNEQQGVVFGMVLIKSGAQRRIVSASTLRNPSTNEALFQAVHTYAVNEGFAGGFPTFDSQARSDGVVYLVILVSSAIAVRRDVPMSALGNPINNEQRFQRLHSYAVANRFIAGFPNFHQANYNDGRGVVFGSLLLKSDAVRMDVPTTILNMWEHWTFDSAFTRQERGNILRQHARGFTQALRCQYITSGERHKLLKVYQSVVDHRRINVCAGDRNCLGEWYGGLNIGVKVDVLFPMGDDEIGQTLIHELMHCAGYIHPETKPSPKTDPEAYREFMATEPLRAEMCIAGKQSDVTDDSSSTGRTTGVTVFLGAVLGTLALVMSNSW